MGNINFKLKSKLALTNMTQTDLAKELGITYSSVNNKINGKIDFTQSEIEKILNILKDRNLEVTYEDIF